MWTSVGRRCLSLKITHSFVPPPPLSHAKRFHAEITTDRTYYQSQGGRKVAVNVVRAASGVMNGGNVCGVAYLNRCA